jgi:hypothetical protein
MESLLGQANHGVIVAFLDSTLMTNSRLVAASSAEVIGIEPIASRILRRRAPARNVPENQVKY